MRRLLCGCGATHGGHRYPKTVLEAAEWKYWYPMADLLRGHPEGANLRDVRDNLPLHLACQGDCPLEIVAALIRAYPAGPTCKNIYGNLPIHSAAASVHSETLQVIKLLLAVYPVGAMTPNKTGVLPLHFHVGMEGATLPVTLALLESYPKGVEMKDVNGHLALHWAVMHDSKPPMDITFSRGRPPPSSQPVVTSVYNAYPEAVKIWDVEGNLALHCAAVDNASLDVLEMLIEAYPEAAGARNLAGQTPLDLARKIKRVDEEDEQECYAMLEDAATAVPDTDVVPNSEITANRLNQMRARVERVDMNKESRVVVAMAEQSLHVRSADHVDLSELTMVL